MEAETAGAHRPLDYDWIASAFLLLFLSFIPVLLPMADAIPEPPKLDEHVEPARKHHRVVLFIIDGLGYRKGVKSGLMPHLEARVRASASGIALASFPTITPSGLRAILSGHRMANEPQLPTGFRTSGELDSVMARAVAGGLKAHVIGQFTWGPIFKDAHGADFSEVKYHGLSVNYSGHGSRELTVNYDDLVLQQAEPVVSGQKGDWDFLVLHFFESDSIGHALGIDNELYDDHLRWLDTKIEGLSRELQSQRPTTFVLLADHGQAADGSHGGMSSIERQVPFVIWGADARPTDFGTFPLYNAAPTLCALLGVRPPALSEGEPLLAGLLLSPESRAQVLVDLARQRLARWQTVRAVLPQASGAPQEGLVEVEAAFRRRQYDVAAAKAERLVRAVDRRMNDVLPEKWLWRLIAGFWIVIVAATFGLAWRQIEVKKAATTALLSVCCLALLAFPIVRPSLWAWCSALVLGSCMGVAVMTLAAGLRCDSGLDPYGWAVWWFAMAGLCYQEFLDVRLWSWLVLLCLFVGRAIRISKANALSTALSAAAAALAWIAVPGPSNADFSLVRSLLPAIERPTLGTLGWNWAADAVLVAYLLGGYFVLIRLNTSRRQWAGYVGALAPFTAVFILRRYSLATAAVVGAACAASLGALLAVRPNDDARGVWLSLVCLTYYRALADDQQWCLLALAVVVGGCLAWRSRDGHPIWEGIGLLAVGLWSYELSGGQLTFSRITVAEGYRLLGAGWHPYALFAVLALKPLAAIGAPIMPRLSVRPLYSVLGVLPLLAAISAGNISMLWWARFMQGGNMKFTDDIGFARTIFVILLSWGILGLWTAVRAADAISGRLRRD